MNKKIIGLGLTSVALLSLAACGNRGASKSDSKDAKTDLKAAIVTDTGGVDDKSFNQSAWEGLEAWGKENGLKKVLVLITSNLTVNLNMLLTLILQYQMVIKLFMVSVLL